VGREKIPRGHTFFDVKVACARKEKLESVKVVTRYDAKELRIDECRKCERKYGSAVIITEAIVQCTQQANKMSLAYHSKAEETQPRA
jgi:hypothetical protein